MVCGTATALLKKSLDYEVNALQGGPGLQVWNLPRASGLGFRAYGPTFLMQQPLLKYENLILNMPAPQLLD